MKKYLKTLIVTSLVTLAPILVGLILWNRLPDPMPTHWNMAGEVDGWSSKAFAVFFLPAFLMAMEWFCMLMTVVTDPKRDNHSEKVVKLVLWIMPLMSIVLHAFTYAAALGRDVPVERFMPIFLGLVFVIIGNYLPKCKQNYTIGIKIPWALNSEENWNKTHRFAGILWVACGLAITVTGFFGGTWIFFAITGVMVLAPVAYSYWLYTRGI